MRASDCALAVCDRQYVLHDTHVATYDKLSLQCRESVIYVLPSVGSEAECPFVRCFEEVEYEKDL